MMGKYIRMSNNVTVDATLITNENIKELGLLEGVEFASHETDSDMLPWLKVDNEEVENGYEIGLVGDWLVESDGKRYIVDDFEFGLSYDLALFTFPPKT